MPTLSSQLVERRVATVRAVEEAIARQVIHGGDLATNLLEIGAVGEADLTLVVASIFGLEPAATGALPEPDAEALKIVPGDMALRHTFFPLELRERTLVVAVAEPLSAAVEEDLSFALDVTIRQLGSTHVRVREGIAANYGLPVDKRLLRLLAKLDGLPDPHPTVHPPPALGRHGTVTIPRPASVPPASFHSGLPGVSELPPGSLGGAPLDVPAMSPPAMTPPAVDLPAAQPALDAPALDTPAPDAVAPEANLDDSPAPGRVGDPKGLAKWLVRAAVDNKPLARRRRPRGPFSLANAEEELLEAQSPEDILDTFFAFGAQFFEFAALFVISGDIAEGRDAHGIGIDREKVAHLGVPLDLPSIFSVVRERGGPVVYRLAEPLDAELARDLGRPDPEAGPRGRIVAIPIVVRNRCVAVLIGDDGRTDATLETIGDVLGFAGVAATTLVRLLVARKRGTTLAAVKVPSPPPAPAPMTKEDEHRVEALARAFALPRAATERPPSHDFVDSDVDGDGDAPVEGAHANAQSQPQPQPPSDYRPPPATAIDPSALVGPPTRKISVVPAPPDGISPGASSVNPDHVYAATEPRMKSPAPEGVSPMASTVTDISDGLVEAIARAAQEDPSRSSAPPERTKPYGPSLLGDAAAPRTAKVGSAPGPGTEPIDTMVGVGRERSEPMDPRAERATPEPEHTSPSPSRAPVTRGRDARRDDDEPASPAPPTTGSPAFVSGPEPTSAPQEGSDVSWDGQSSNSEDDEEHRRDPPPATAAAVHRLSRAPIPREDESGAMILEKATTPSPAMRQQAQHGMALLRQLMLGGLEADRAMSELLRLSDTEMTALVAHFPGPLTADRYRNRDQLPVPSQCGPMLALLAVMGRSALPHVTVRTSSPDPDVRFWATHLLGELMFAEASNALIPRLFDDDVAVRRVARRSAALLVHAGDAGVPLLWGLDHLARNRDEPPHRRVVAIETMGEIRHPGSVEPLLFALGEKHPDVATAAHRSLVLLTRQDFETDRAGWEAWWTEHRDRHRVEWLIDALMHPSAAIRRAAGDELKQVTKEYFGYYDDLPERERAEAQGRYRDWWDREGVHRFT